MSSANAGWLFYKKMYEHLYVNIGTRPKSLDEEYIEQINSEVLNTEFQPTSYFKSKYSFPLTTLYPGLLIGTGYNHNAKECKPNFDFGFYFEHTSGMPLLPGSSIKGVIRSVFKKLNDDNQKESVVSFFKELFSQCKISIFLGHSTEDAIKVLEKIEKHIFDGIDDNGNNISIYNRDKFFDAVVTQGIEAKNSLGQSKNLVFADDYITPHHQNLLKEPEPNHMLKVRSGVIFEFNFDLKDSFINDDIHLLASQKLSLFQAILEFEGIGAKTNVGYGQFEKIEEEIGNSKDKENRDRNTEVKPEKTFSMIKNEVQGAMNGKSVKNKIKNETDNMSAEEKQELLKLVVEKITEHRSNDDNWSSGDIAAWMNNDMSKKERKSVVGSQDYLDVLKLLLKE